MAKSSIHFEPVKTSSEIHNYRLKDFDYIRKDLKNLNESWTGETIANTRKNIEERYFATVRQKMQSKATPIREGVLNIEQHHTMDDLKRVSNALEQRWGIKTFQIHIHKDEGHRSSQKAWKSNLHAHILCDWTDQNTGKSIKMGPDDMKEMQSIVADTLSMERGKSSSKKHLTAIQFKNEAEAKRLEELEKAQIQAEKALSVVIRSKEDEIEKHKSDLKHLEGIKSGLNDLEGKYIAKGILGTVDTAKTAENIKALHLSHQETKKELEDLKKRYESQSNDFQKKTAKEIDHEKRFSATREQLFSLARVVLSKGKLTLTASGEAGLRVFLKKEFIKDIDKAIDERLAEIIKRNEPKKGLGM